MTCFTMDQCYYIWLFLLSSCVWNLSAASASQTSNETPRGKLLSNSFGVPGINASFDYVVVGGGTAGLVMATRLAEDPANSVAVVEAGGFYELDNGNISVVPGYARFYAGTSPNDTQPLVDWGFVTVPQAGANNRRMHYACGKTLGGSSARNYLFYQRPTIGSLDKWAAEVGDSSYTFDNFLPYFKKSVHYTPPNTRIFTNSSVVEDPEAFSKSGGPLQVSYNGFVGAFATWVQQALKALGMFGINGFNSGKLIGAAYGTFTLEPTSAQRSSSESSFLQSAIKNTTLQIYKQTLALRILFDKTNSAIGVVVSTQGNHDRQTIEYTLRARKEVIVSAGAFQSPQLLMVSGIGPKATLAKFGIPVLKDLPGVGQNLWDHAYFGSSFRVNVPTASAPANDPSLRAEEVQTYLKNASGPLSISVAGIFGWEKFHRLYRNNLSASTRSALAKFPADWPELEWIPANAYLGYGENFQTGDPLDGYNYATMSTALVAPLSRGNISIRSGDMQDAPLINPNWITDPVDIELAIAAFKRQRRFWAVLASYNLTIGAEQFPGPTVQSNAQILDFIQKALTPVWHASATCRMGRSNDTQAVIDSSARVYGTRRLRVVDASSFPFLPPGHPQATIYALAEKIAQEILDGK